MIYMGNELRAAEHAALNNRTIYLVTDFLTRISLMRIYSPDDEMMPDRGWMPVWMDGWMD